MEYGIIEGGGNIWHHYIRGTKNPILGGWEKGTGMVQGGVVSEISMVEVGHNIMYRINKLVTIS